MKSFILLILAVLSMPAWVFANGPSGKTEITIYSGISFLEAEREITPPCILCDLPARPGILPIFTKVSFESGFLFGFKVGHYLNSNVEVEGNFAIGPSQEVITDTFDFCPPDLCLLPQGDLPFPFLQAEESGVSYYYDGNFVYNFPFKNITPYATVGIGGISTDIQENTRSDVSFNFGAGVKSYFKQIGIRFEVNDHVIPDHFISDDTEHDLQLQYGVTFRL